MNGFWTLCVLICGASSTLEGERSQLTAETTYKEGKGAGFFRSYYENGQLTAETTYKDGKEEIISGYYESGVKKYERLFKNGIQNGIEKWY